MENYIDWFIKLQLETSVLAAEDSKTRKHFVYEHIRLAINFINVPDLWIPSVFCQNLTSRGPQIQEKFEIQIWLYKLLQEAQKVTKSEAKGTQNLCPNRWTVRGNALAAFIDTYIELMDLWDWSLQATGKVTRC